MHIKSLKNLVLIILGLLLIPLIAMQFSQEVNWSLLDFIIAGIILLVAGVGIEFIKNKVKSPNLRALSLAVVILLIVLLWAELAVGIFETPLAGN